MRICCHLRPGKVAGHCDDLLGILHHCVSVRGCWHMRVIPAGEVDQDQESMLTMCGKSVCILAHLVHPWCYQTQFVLADADLARVGTHGA